jgi:hypothetical protein
MAVAKKKTSQKTKPESDCIFVKLSDGIFIDLTQVQAYRHEEGQFGRVYLKGGNSLETPCGEELVKRLRQYRVHAPD